MDELSHVSNGRFLYDLSNWTLTGAPTFSVGDGDEHYGVAALAVDDAIAQEFSLSYARQYTLHLSLKCSAQITAGQVTAVITDEDGNLVKTIQPAAAAATWTDSETVIGLVPGTTYTLTITNVSASSLVKVDDVWLWYVPITRAQLAAQVHTRLGRLATDRSLNTTAAGSLTEGSYTYAVDAGLRAVSAINEETDLPDVRILEAGNVDAALDAIEQAMLKQLHRDYAAEVDISVGPRRESLSQKSAAIEKLIGAAGSQGAGMGRIQQRKLRHVMAERYEPTSTDDE